MELRQLRHFLALADEAHFGRAAERLCLSQPALSTSISKLEYDFGFRLFERDNKTVRITLAGEQMLSYAREIINQANRTQNMARMLASGKSGRIEMGFTGTVFRQEIQRLITQCREENPGIEIALREVSSQKQLELLHAARLDAGLVTVPLPPTDLEHIALFEDRFVVCVPSDHALARRKGISISELRDEPFVLQSRESSPVIYDMLIGLCVAAGFYPNVVSESSHILSTINLVSRGIGIGFVLNSLVDIHADGVAFVAIDQPVLPRRCGYFIWNSQRSAPGLDALVQSFRTFAHARLHSQKSD
ncbi:LysR substrate-binding domain-containing protein [Paraburkholderia sp.]|uniref:LysR substrate-binding domain-containing protein n=1 Tax=Paraburkholderia sp. TaxID=1926495 RepID=UPI0039E7002F